jgi:hypothetical protein
VAITDSNSFKPCARCGVIKPASREYFSACKHGLMGLHSWCKPCCAMERRADRAARPEHYASIETRRYQRDRKKRNAACRAKWAECKEQYSVVLKARTARNKERYNASRRVVRDANPQKYIDQQRAWFEKNREQQLKNRRDKWRTAPRIKRLRYAIGSAISRSIKRGTKGGKGWQELVGYTTAELMAHLEKQFTPGITWKNYGPVWHIDHIVPVSSFVIETVRDPAFKSCWALANLRPLLAKANLNKSKKLIFLL